MYCLPILKRETHRQALLTAATSGHPKFFLGTDSAPHAVESKLSTCGNAVLWLLDVAFRCVVDGNVAFPTQAALESSPATRRWRCTQRRSRACRRWIALKVRLARLSGLLFTNRALRESSVCVLHAIHRLRKPLRRGLLRAPQERSQDHLAEGKLDRSGDVRLRRFEGKFEYLSRTCARQRLFLCTDGCLVCWFCSRKTRLCRFVQDKKSRGGRWASSCRARSAPFVAFP